MTRLIETNSINIPKILRAIWLNQGISRIDLARLLNIDKSTVTNIVSKLLEAGIITVLSEGKAGSSGGRKPVSLAVNRDFGAVIGIEIQPYSSYKLVVTNLDGEIIETEFREVSFTRDNFVSRVAGITGSVQGRISLPVIAVGIGLSGIIDSENGVIHRSIPLDITSDFDVYRAFDEYDVTIPVLLENDANCCAWGEISARRDEHIRNCMALLIEYREEEVMKKGRGGIAAGIGIVIDGKVYGGGNHTAGEFKSVFADPGSINQFSLPEDEIVDILHDRKIFHKFMTELARNMALMVNTFAMDHLFFGGTRTDFQDDIIPIFEKAIRDNWMYDDHSECRICEFSRKDLAVAFGAAGLILEHLFSVPAHTMRPDRKQAARHTIISSIRSIVEMNGTSVSSRRYMP